VRAARARLSGALKQAVLASGRAELLAGYGQLPEAADDLAFWQACLTVLPAGSARRTAAAAHVQRLQMRSRRGLSGR
jgi:hypothetical protein